MKKVYPPKKKIEFKASQLHYDILTFSQRITLKEAQDMLLSHKDKITYKGKVFRLIARPIGCGIYEVKKELTVQDRRDERQRLLKEKEIEQ